MKQVAFGGSPWKICIHNALPSYNTWYCAWRCIITSDGRLFLGSCIDTVVAFWWYLVHSLLAIALILRGYPDYSLSYKLLFFIVIHIQRHNTLQTTLLSTPYVLPTETDAWSITASTGRRLLNTARRYPLNEKIYLRDARKGEMNRGRTQSKSDYWKGVIGENFSRRQCHVGGLDRNLLTGPWVRR